MESEPCMAAEKMMELLRAFYSVHATMGEEQKRQSALLQAKPRSKRARNDTKDPKGPQGGNSRHVAWTADDASHYHLVRPGIPLAGAAEADERFANKTLQEAHFYLWKHNDPHVERNRSVPKWEATYYFEDRKEYARVKKCHLKVAYQAAGRCAPAQMWTMDPQTQLPYWVDRYAFSKLMQQSSKRKYEDSKRKADKEGPPVHVGNHHHSTE